MITDEVLQKFTATEDTRYNLTKIWIRNGWKCATDGRVLVRVRTIEPDTCDGKNPNTNDIADDSQFGNQELEIPTSEEKEQCPKCLGEGKVKNICEICDGEGEVECPTCHEGKVDCEECDGRGRLGEAVVKCENCQGEGKIFSKVKIGEQFFNGNYVHKIKTYLPITKAISPNENNRPIKMKFDGGECILMPLFSSD